MIILRKCKTKYRDNRGVALMVAVIIIGILMVFVLSLLLASYTLYASQNKKAAATKCAEAANTLSQALETELTADDAPTQSSLWKYLRCNILQEEYWPYYDPSEANHGEAEAYRYFDINPNLNYFSTGYPDGFPASVKLRIYWTLPDKLDLNGQHEYELSTTKKTGVRLNIMIICESASQSYTVTNVYELSPVTYDDADADMKDEKEKVEKILSIGSGNQEYNPALIDSSRYNPNERWVWDFIGRE